jgi:hypothetical protein
MQSRLYCGLYSCECVCVCEKSFSLIVATQVTCNTVVSSACLHRYAVAFEDDLPTDAPYAVTIMGDPMCVLWPPPSHLLRVLSPRR